MPNAERHDSGTRHWTTSGELSHISGIKDGERRAVARPSGKPVASARVLLHNLIDYAGLFPPAGLEMKTAVTNFLGYRKSENTWMLGRFIVPASRLAELTEVMEQIAGEHSLWKISAILGPQLLGDLAVVRGFNQVNDGRVIIDALEMKPTTQDEVRRAREYIDRSMQIYVEVPSAIDPTEMLDAAKLANAYAKVRTGGLNEAMIPPVADLARFLVACATDKVAFKATAGLHHPVRGVQPFSYEKGSAAATMHGFLNVFIAASIARAGAAEPEVASVLEADSFDQFSFADDGITVSNLRGETQEFHISTELLRETRRSFAVSFGSCSFEEPVQDLQALGLL